MRTSNALANAMSVNSMAEPIRGTSPAMRPRPRRLPIHANEIRQPSHEGSSQTETVKGSCRGETGGGGSGPRRRTQGDRIGESARMQPAAPWQIFMNPPRPELAWPRIETAPAICYDPNNHNLPFTRGQLPNAIKRQIELL